MPSERPASVRDAFDLTGRVAIVTGGAGLLGAKHAEAIAEMGGVPVLLDIRDAEARSREIGAGIGLAVDITRPVEVEGALSEVVARYGRVDILVNNAANNPKAGETRLEDFPPDAWARDLDVGLTGAFLCAKVFGAEMARRRSGVILNIASDLAVIGPDQRIYDPPTVKPVSYSVVKAGLIGLTRYLATYWAGRAVRANALLPGGVENGQDPAFVRRLASLIPMGRMARPDEYKAAVVFLVSDASSYMTGALVSIDGGRTAW